MDQKDIDLYVLARNVIFRYQLDQYEDEQLAALLQAFDRARRTLGKRLDALAPEMEGSFTQERALALLDEVNAMTAGLRQKTAGDIGAVSTSAGVQAFAVHQDIVSIGGLLAVNTLSVTPEQIKALVVDTPIGGRTLAGWVEKTFDHQMVERIREEVTEGVILGEGYPSMVKRLEEAVDITKRDAITLARTYVHNVNTSAQEAVYRANKDVVKGMQWCATLENGRLSTGHGTCLRCASLDGTVYKLDEEHPPIPLHPRCRCVMLPSLISWRDMGIPIDELEDATRPYTMRELKNIDAGGKRTILEVGHHDGDYSSWFETLSEKRQLEVLGPGRLALYRDGKVDFHEFVDGSGRLRTIEELKGGRAPRGGSGQGGPIPAAGG